MFCPQCGASNADNAAICVQCGRNLQPAATPLAATGQVIPPGATVENYLVFAILATVLCCLPTGIAAIVYAAQVNGKLQAGDFAGAQQASRNAKMWCWISFGLGLATFAVSILLAILGVVTGLHH
ncbi:MAG TPA: CD225/dispanin family protein [Candidatus Sulfotelmatobacter sp.]|nr:CD225/dispanin family protein [Candidatus Sulfotelmatobacter sp.]